MKLKATRGFFLLGVIALMMAVALPSTVQAAACPSPITTDTTLTADCTGGLFIGTDNITLDCDGHTLTGAGFGQGIRLNAAGVTVKNCTVTNFGQGFAFAGGASTTGNLLEKNTASGNGQGFVIAGGVTGNLFKENAANDNTLAGHDNIGFRANAFGNHYEQNTASGNGGLGGFHIRSVGSTFKDNIASDNGRGFFFDGGSGNILESNIAIDNTSAGFFMRSADDNLLKSNLSMNSNVGFILVTTFLNSTGNTLDSNEASDNALGCRDDTGATAATVLNTWINNTSIANTTDSSPVGLCPSLDVETDVKPGSNPNCVNPNSGGRISVAYLGSDSLDVADIDPGTLVWGGTSPVRCNFEDVDEDGLLDLVCKYRKSEVELPEPPEDCVIVAGSGALLDGTPFVASDHVCVAGGPACDASIPQ